MFRRGFANKLRLVLGIAIAIMVGAASYNADGDVWLTFGLPLIILLLSLADFIGYLASEDESKPHAGSAP